MTSSPGTTNPTTFRARLRAGDDLTGAWCALGDPLAVEIVGKAGFDWLGLDMQHGTATAPDLGVLLDAAVAGGAAALVRLAWKDPAAAMAALDAGADGVIVPMVNTPQEAAAIASACRYAPAGSRSWGPVRRMVRDPGYAPDVANDSTVCAVMVEGPAAVEQVDRIAAVEGVDALFLGPFDLALASGTTVEQLLDGSSPVLRQVVDACRDAGVAAGAYGATPPMGARMRAAGFTMVAVATDTILLQQAAMQAATGDGREPPQTS